MRGRLPPMDGALTGMDNVICEFELAIITKHMTIAGVRETICVSSWANVNSQSHLTYIISRIKLRKTQIGIHFVYF